MLKEPATHTKRGRVTAYGFSQGLREETVDGVYSLWKRGGFYIVSGRYGTFHFKSLKNAREFYDSSRGVS